MRRLGVIAVVFLGVPNAGFGATFVVSGHGWGHGVGMSQWGAEGLAMHGWGYSRILDHYYPGTSLGREHGGAVRVLLAGGRRRVTISSRARFRVVDGRGRWHRLERRHVVLTRKLLRFPPPLVFVPSTAPLALNGSAYRGNLVVRQVRLNTELLDLERPGNDTGRKGVEIRASVSGADGLTVEALRD